MKKQLMVFATGTALFLGACTGTADQKNNEKKDAKAQDNEKVAQDCSYSYEDGSAKVNWTAFKTTDKVAVGGQFDDVKVTAEAGDDFTSVIESIAFEIQTASTNTKDTARDAKIVNAFFGSMNNPNLINGEVKSVKGDENSGEIIFDLSMNDTTNAVRLAYTVKDKIINMEGSIDMMNFNGEEAVKALNKVCNALHKGADGVSKTWNEVDLKIAAKIKKDC